jgi:hypothetical protein
MAEKLAQLRATSNYTVLTALDDIAWLCNLRSYSYASATRTSRLPLFFLLFRPYVALLSSYTLFIFLSCVLHFYRHVVKVIVPSSLHCITSLGCAISGESNQKTYE